MIEKRNLVTQGKAPEFTVGNDDILRGKGRVCVPKDAEMRKMILDEGHKSSLSIHLGATKMYQDLKLHFWGPGMKKQVAEYVSTYLTCQKVKVEHQKPAGKLQSLDVPEWKWDSISKKFDAIWVVVDRLTKTAHFIPIKLSYKVEQLAEIYVAEIVRLHGVPSSIV